MRRRQALAAQSAKKEAERVVIKFERASDIAKEFDRQMKRRGRPPGAKNKPKVEKE